MYTCTVKGATAQAHNASSARHRERRAAACEQMRSILALALLSGAHGFYLPGVAPKDYMPGEHVDLKVNKVRAWHLGATCV